jgi:hypothetical protein
MEADREKIDKTEFGCIHFTTIFEFEYEYLYLCFSGYGYQIIRIPFPYFYPYSPLRSPTHSTTAQNLLCIDHVSVH